MITSPGERRFKLRLTNDKLYPVVCDELANETCTSCRNGFLEVAYGQHNGIYDVFKLKCRCKWPEGIEWWQAADTVLYRNRPVSYTTPDPQVYVFIHPVHSGSRMAQVKQRINRIIERFAAEETDELPF